ncbi:MAG TPA: hypothetical protein PLE61_04930 [Vicinamibacterales bacterium]|nr:hypothetical protein [Vicinamibacterales bacterium]HPW20141.1 hypothetical protein [Vicinamibacterales bacterium]
MHLRLTHPPASPAFLALLGALAMAASASTSAAQPAERDMFVSVVDRGGSPVLTLGPEDFVVRDDDRLREVLRARRASDLLHIAVLVDTSQALGSQVSDVRQGLLAFAARMGAQARIALVGFGDRPTVLSDYSSSADAVARGVGLIFPIQGAGACVLDAVDETLAGLEKAGPERSAIVVVWAGGREFGHATDTELIERLAANGTALHVLVIGGGVPEDVRTPEGRHREGLFDRGTTATGGRRTNVLSSMAAADALERLAAELLGQYRITFARPESLIPPKKTIVAVRPEGLTARGLLVPVRAAARQ